MRSAAAADGGGPAPHDSESGMARLTPREQEVLELLALGYTNREIGGELTISVRTVETHRASILAKLGLRTRADLVRYSRSRTAEARS